MKCKRTFLSLVIAALLLSPLQAVGVAAQSRTIEGTWEVTVSLHRTISVTHPVTLNGDDEYSGTGTAVFHELDDSSSSVAFDTEGRRISAEP